MENLKEENEQLKEMLIAMAQSNNTSLKLVDFLLNNDFLLNTNRIEMSDRVKRQMEANEECSDAVLMTINISDAGV